MVELWNMIEVYICILDIELPNEQGRMDILKIHASSITKHGEIGNYIAQILQFYLI